ncbi:MAG: DUF99 family protein [Candidatus Micrarchaeaceae archaeon]|nr:DUF99 family protein [Candidatus Marsarchaeota archaeon]
MKSGIRIAAAASGPIKGRKSTLLVIVVYREGIVEGVLSDTIGVDSSDSSKKIISRIRRSRFKDQVKMLALNGIALAGLNVVDVHSVSKALGVEFIILTRKKPHKDLLIKAVERIKGDSKVGTKAAIAAKRDIGLIDSVGMLQIKKVNGFYAQSSLDLGKSDSGLVMSAFEALRIAHLIANGVETGESKGRI